MTKLTESVPPKTIARWVLLAGVKRHLTRTSTPRLQMIILVLATGSVGLLTSVCLLRLHMEMMVLRYVVSVTVAYGAFLAMVWLWLVAQRRRWRRRARAGSSLRKSRGAVPSAAAPSKSSSLLDWLEVLDIFDGDHLIGTLLVAAGVVSIFFVIWSLISTIALAPEFLAEVFLDGVFSAALYRRLSRIEHRHWLQSAFARTRAPFLWTLSFFAFIGVVAHYYAPEAISIGGVIRHLTAPDR